MNLDYLRLEERLALELKALYLSYGYLEFRLSSFEEYSLYAENKSFLSGRDVISFSAGGKLLALRPDVTLSVVKNVNVGGCTKKLFYDEKVYRKIAGGNFSEVDQIGVEVIGKVDLCAEAEVATLALKTLKAVGRSCVLDLSHVGIISKAADALGVSDNDRAFALDCLEQKNEHDFLRFAKERGIGKAADAFASLISLPSKPSEALDVLVNIARFIDISSEVEEMRALVSIIGDAEINFSAVGDDEYYNGLVFKGYVAGIPHAILSGGRYDKLLDKFSKSAEAIGFALYSGELAKYFRGETPSLDGVVLYDDDSALLALETAEKLRKNGRKILLSRDIPEDFKGEIYSAEGKND